MTRVIIVDGGSGFTNVQALLQRLEEEGVDAQAMSLADAQAQGLVRQEIPLRITAEAPAPLHYYAEPKLKGTGRSELARLRSQAFHNKSRKP